MFRFFPNSLPNILITTSIGRGLVNSKDMPRKPGVTLYDRTGR